MGIVSHRKLTLPLWFLALDGWSCGIADAKRVES